MLCFKVLAYNTLGGRPQVDTARACVEALLASGSASHCQQFGGERGAPLTLDH